MPAAHDIYAEQLSECRRGYPLYYPEPSPLDGPIQIGDVGFLKQGAFHRLFNVSLSHNDPAQTYGVPDGFERLDLGRIRHYEAALEPGPLHSKTIFATKANVGVSGTVLPVDASFHFRCASERGAILMQETRMRREEAIQTQLLEDYLRSHYQSWYNFAKRNHFSLGFGQIMLVTECSKTAAWSSAVYSNSKKEFGVSFSVGNAFVPTFSTSAGVERVGSIERRRSEQHPTGNEAELPKEHTVFFKAYQLGIRKSIQTFISILVPNRSLKPTKNFRGTTIPNAGWSASTDSSQPSTSSSEPPGSGSNQLSLETPVTHLEFPDFHPIYPLLASKMMDTDAECVIIHDNEWCSPTEEASQLIAKYIEAHFRADALIVDLPLSKPMIDHSLRSSDSSASYSDPTDLHLLSADDDDDNVAITDDNNLCQTINVLKKEGNERTTPTGHDSRTWDAIQGSDALNKAIVPTPITVSENEANPIVPAQTTPREDIMPVQGTSPQYTPKPVSEEHPSHPEEVALLDSLGLRFSEFLVRRKPALMLDKMFFNFFSFWSTHGHPTHETDTNSNPLLSIDSPHGNYIPDHPPFELQFGASPRSPFHDIVLWNWVAYVESRHREFQVVICVTVTCLIASPHFLQLAGPKDDDPISLGLIYIAIIYLFTSLTFTLVHRSNGYDMAQLPCIIFAVPAIAFCWASPAFLQIARPKDVNPIIEGLISIVIFHLLTSLASALALLYHFSKPHFRSYELAHAWYMTGRHNFYSRIPWMVFTVPVVIFCWAVVAFFVALLLFVWNSWISSDPLFRVGVYSLMAIRAVITMSVFVDMGCFLWLGFKLFIAFEF